MILGIDTTTKICEINLKVDDKYFIEKLDEGLVHSDKLIPLIKNVLEVNNLDVKNISEIVVNIGPGSFTGIRVGVSCARALAQVLNIKIKPVVSMDIIKFGVMQSNQYDFDFLIVLLDALRGECFCGIYDKNGDKVEDYKIYGKNDILILLQKDLFRHKKIVIAGNGYSNFSEVFKQFDNIKKYVEEKNEKFNLIKSAIHEKIVSKNYWEVKPFYIRKIAAEETTMMKMIGMIREEKR